jgi:uncharacterized protein YndB with AHSA1/START domain
MDFREGGTSLVCMRSPDSQDLYNNWTYREIVPMQRIEFIQNVSDEEGLQIDSVRTITHSQSKCPHQIPRSSAWTN